MTKVTCGRRGRHSTSRGQTDTKSYPSDAPTYRVAARAGWNLAVQAFDTPTAMGAYLEKAATTGERAEVQMLPANSRRRVDWLIEIHDEHGCVDEQLRAKIHGIMRVLD